MNTTTHTPQAPFAPGDCVYVRDYDISYTGTVVRYWRNGYFIIREDEHGTECAHHHSKLEHPPPTNHPEDKPHRQLRGACLHEESPNRGDP